MKTCGFGFNVQTVSVGAQVPPTTFWFCHLDLAAACLLLSPVADSTCTQQELPQCGCWSPACFSASRPVFHLLTTAGGQTLFVPNFFLWETFCSINSKPFRWEAKHLQQQVQSPKLNHSHLQMTWMTDGLHRFYFGNVFEINTGKKKPKTTTTCDCKPKKSTGCTRFLIIEKRN